MRIEAEAETGQGLPTERTTAGERSSGHARRLEFLLHDVAVEVASLRGKLNDIEVGRTLGENVLCGNHHGLITCIHHLLDRAEDAARRGRPGFRSLCDWWSGNRIEAAYRNLHRAEAEIAKLYDEGEVRAAQPEATSRLRCNLPQRDARLEAVGSGHDRGAPERLRLSYAIQIGHEAKDQKYARIRRFRTIVNSASVLIIVFLSLFAVVVSFFPPAVPLCFGLPARSDRACPAGISGTGSSWDVWVVILLGLLGGALAAAVSVRNIRGAPTPYNLATSLALLKVPSGALTAVGALILINGHAIPGLQASLDSQQQILAYALVFGYGQQVLTRLVGQRAGELSSGIPSKHSQNGEALREANSD